MKNVLIAAAALAMISSSALAQEPPKPPAPPSAEAPGTPPPPPPHRGPPPLEKSAHIRVEDKGFKVDVKCSEDESTNDCAEIVYKLLDRVGPPKK